MTRKFALNVYGMYDWFLFLFGNKCVICNRGFSVCQQAGIASDTFGRKEGSVGALYKLDRLAQIKCHCQGLTVPNLFCFAAS